MTMQEYEVSPNRTIHRDDYVVFTSHDGRKVYSQVARILPEGANCVEHATQVAHVHLRTVHSDLDSDRHRFEWMRYLGEDGAYELVSSEDIYARFPHEERRSHTMSKEAPRAFNKPPPHQRVRSSHR